MIKKIVAIVIIAIFSGCVSTKNIPIDHSKIKLMKPEKILISKRNKPDFAAMTSMKGTLGLIGALAAISEGNNLIKDNAVKNPASTINSELINDLSKKYNLNIVESNKYIDTSDISDIAETYSKTDWILDIETINWGFYYYPTRWDQYKVIYSAKLRLIDAKNKSMIAEGFCARVPNDVNKSLNYDELIAVNAVGLKSELQKATNYCIDNFKQNILKI